MSDDFDDDEGQNRLVIDDHNDSSEVIASSISKSIETGDNDTGRLTELKDDFCERTSRSPELMDTNELLSTKADTSAELDDGHQSDEKNNICLSSDASKVSLTRKQSTSDDCNSDAKDCSGDVDELKNFLPPVPKKKKMVDKSTCVLTKACQVDENLFSLKSGTTTCINITILCKAGGNTLLIVTKWRGKEYYGILSDGEPMFAHTYAQKRNVSMGGERSTDHGEKSNLSAGKSRGKRGGRVGVDKRGKNADVATDGEEAADGDGKNAEDLCKASSKLVEHGSDKPFLRCPHKQCGYKLDSMSDVNTHLFMSHVDTTAVITESIASQTVPPPAKVSRGVDACDLSANVNGPGAIATNGNVLCSRCRHSVLEDGPADNKDSQPSIKQTSENSPGDAFSDISDDGAPTLEKEENFDKNNDTNTTSKKTPVNEAINIFTPSVAGPSLDMLSPVLSSSSSATTAAGFHSDASARKATGNGGGNAKQPSNNAENAVNPTSKSSPIVARRMDTTSSSSSPCAKPASSQPGDTSPAIQQPTRPIDIFQPHPQRSGATPTSSVTLSMGKSAVSSVAQITTAATTSATKISVGDTSPAAAIVAQLGVPQQLMLGLHHPAAVAATAAAQVAALDVGAPPAAVLGGGNTVTMPSVSSAVGGLAPPQMYMTPFQPNFYNSSFFNALQQQQCGGGAAGVSVSKDSVGGALTVATSSQPSSSMAFMGGSGPSSSGAANGFSPIPSSSATASFGGGGQKLSIDHSSAALQQRHKIHELKSQQQSGGGSGSNTAAMMLSGQPTSSSQMLGIATGSGVTGAMGSASDSASPMRPSSAISSAAGFMRQAVHSPNTSGAALSATQLFGNPSSIPPNLSSSPVIAASLTQQQQAMYQQQQLQQQIRQMMPNMQSMMPNPAMADQLLAALLAMSSQQAQPQQPPPQQFPHPSQK